MKYTAVAFDLDGTLYPAYRLNLRLIPFGFKNICLLRAMGRVRTLLRRTGAYEADFYELQARLMAEILNKDPQKVREDNERLIYRGWEPFFKEIELFPRVRETLRAFREAGIRMGLLSDFPPEKKLENLGLADCWDAVICSEQVGRLKPDSAPFLELARRMGAAPRDMLYVGNSLSYDVEGACRAGMKAALIRPWWKKTPFTAEQVFVFYDYRQLHDFVLH